jgi:hypothetical protein
MRIVAQEGPRLPWPDGDIPDTVSRCTVSPLRSPRWWNLDEFDLNPFSSVSTLSAAVTYY